MVIDGFMGAGGWSVALDELGIPSVGIELDDAPIAVARAAGHEVIQGDIAALDPLEFAPCEGCCFSPPCPSFSSAGRGAGREISEPILAVIADLAAGRDTRAQRRREAYAILEPDTAHLDELPVPLRRRKREQHAASPVDRDRIAWREATRATAKRDAAISLLVVEPLRWALALEPRWIALEQVPPVLPLWEAMAVALRERGYSVWCGIMSSERVGVPQTRKRAILIASLDREVREPPATHQRYIAPRKRATDDEAMSLFEEPEPERIVHREDRDLLPWVSMAEALSWGMTARPSVSLLAKTGGTGGHRPLEGGSGARDTLDRARADGEWMPQDLVGFPRRNDRPDDDAEYRERDLRAASEPAFGVTETMRSWTRFVSNGQANATTRGVDEPAPTIATGHSTAERRVGGDGTPVALVPVDRPAPTQQAEALAQGRDVWVTGQRRNSGPGAEREPRDLSDPSYTVRAAGSGSHPSGVEWVGERPSTSVNCDPRVAEPGRHAPDDAGSQYGPATVRVSIEEAAALQGFPSSYPWEAAGTKTAAFRAVGNAICPPLALHVLAMATGRELP